MSNLQVSEVNVPAVIKKLKTSEWLSPLFQRDFVWSNASVVALINSIIDARPVGMITLWEQEGNSALPLEAISIPDADPITGKTAEKYFSDASFRPGRYYAILDGRQRSTALALAFGGLRAASAKFRNAGRYFLDVTAKENVERVKFVPEKEVLKRNFNTLKVAISHGHFPLEVDDPDNIFDQWMSYLQHIRNPAFYADGVLPDEAELERRNKVLQSAFNGIIKTKIAIYTVPQTYDLAEICDIFETLNTTGTKVSTVDLIHSNIYSDTSLDQAGPILVRDSIDELGEMDGAIGWSSSKERPELIAQFAASIHVALDSKPDPRPIGTKEYRISSVKSQDLLALPATHWRKLFSEGPRLAGYLGAFQNAVAGGSFGMAQCPYPAIAAIYIGLRWYREFDAGPHITWTPEDHLDPIFRAMFWRNVFATRYDQGFLTQIGTDLRSLKSFLNKSPTDGKYDTWRANANSWLDENIAKVPDEASVYDVVTDGSEAGALKRAGTLLLYARATVDTVDGSSIHYGSGQLQLHHIYPKDWCANNKVGGLVDAADKRDFVNSAANLMPMSRSSNLLWRKKHPSQFLKENELVFDARGETWNSYFVNRSLFELLENASNPLDFWELRGREIAKEILHRMTV